MHACQYVYPITEPELGKMNVRVMLQLRHSYYLYDTCNFLSIIQLCLLTGHAHFLPSPSFVISLLLWLSFTLCRLLFPHFIHVSARATIFNYSFGLFLTSHCLALRTNTIPSSRHISFQAKTRTDATDLNGNAFSATSS